MIGTHDVVPKRWTLREQCQPSGLADDSYLGSRGVESASSPYSGDVQTRLFLVAFAMVVSGHLSLSVQVTVKIPYQARSLGGIEWSRRKQPNPASTVPH